MPSKSEIEELLLQALIPHEPVEYLNLKEVGDALFFCQTFLDKVRFDITAREWYLWNGLYWTADGIGRVYNLVGEQLAQSYEDAGQQATSDVLKKRFMQRSYSLRTLNGIRNVLNLARRRPELCIDASEWQLPPMLLPAANGLIDLRTGQLREPSPQDRIRVTSPTPWRGLDYPASRWEKLLDEIFGGDSDLIAFVQRLLGYAISGMHSEQVLPILWGTGANGKSTIVDALIEVLGPDLSCPTQSDSLMDVGRNDGDAARPFVAALQDKRVVWASESREGARLNVGLVKQLTGDGYITARNLYAGPVSFRQSHTILLITNHRPRLPEGDDEAIWRRVLLIPFTQRFIDDPKRPNEHRRQRGIGDTLKDEAPGILAWLVRGCIEWQRIGLQPPAVVQQSTAEYREDEDLVGQYMKERLVAGEDCSVATGDVYRDYTAWCELMGYKPVPARALGQRVTGSFGPARVRWANGKSHRVYSGLQIVE